MYIKTISTDRRREVQSWQGQLMSKSASLLVSDGQTICPNHNRNYSVVLLHAKIQNVNKILEGFICIVSPLSLASKLLGESSSLAAYRSMLLLCFSLHIKYLSLLQLYSLAVCSKTEV
jgi:hypothetical protein